MFQERRKQFLINKPLQFRYMAFISMTLLIVSGLVIFSLYFGIWGGILSAFSDDDVRDQLLIASRLQQYENARTPTAQESKSMLDLFKQTEKMSQRQREIFKDILKETNKQIVQKLLLLLVLIAWGSIYLSHKIAGPLYRFRKSLKDLGEGNLKDRIQLRDNDEAKFVADEFNDAVEHLDFSVSRMKNIIKTNSENPELMVKRLKDELKKYKTSVDS